MHKCRHLYLKKSGCKISRMDPVNVADLQTAVISLPLEPAHQPAAQSTSSSLAAPSDMDVYPPVWTAVLQCV